MSFAQSWFRLGLPARRASPLRSGSAARASAAPLAALRMLVQAFSMVVATGLWLLGSACASGPLARPAILGASASSGVGAEIRDYRRPKDDPVPVDLQAVFDAAVPAWGAEAVLLADPSFYLDPTAAADRQIAAARLARPTAIIAIDYLFWSAYGGQRAAEGAAVQIQDVVAGTGAAVAGGVSGVEEESGVSHQVAALERALASLEWFNGPILIGDLPDLNAVELTAMPRRWIPDSSAIAHLNEQVYAWAAARPNVVVLPLGALTTAIHSSLGVHQCGIDIDRRRAAGLVQRDGLHPTAEGLVVLFLAGMHELESRGVIGDDVVEMEIDGVLARLPAAARALQEERRSGPLAVLGLLNLRKRFEQACDAKDCERAAALGAELFADASRIRESPHEMAGIATSFTLWGYIADCPDAAVQMRMWRERLTPKVRAARPDPWPFELWSILNTELDEDGLTLDRLVEMNENLGEVPAGLDGVVKSMTRRMIRDEPVKVMSLIRDLRPRLDELSAIVVGNVRALGKPEPMSKFDQALARGFDEQLSKAETQSERAAIAKERHEMLDHDARIERQLLETGVDFVEWERACTLAGRDADAALVRQVAERDLGPDRYRAATAALAAELMTPAPG